MIKPSLLFPLVISTLLLLSCKQPERVVVTDDPTSASPEPEETDTSVETTGFKQLNIGEPDRIPSLDPLFAENASTMRALQLVYEGLVRYNENGTVVPAVAQKWSVSPDSLTYRFTLRNDIYYHDSNVFSNGIGRKLVAGDVKYAFERMARIDVPGHAARLFMDILGFEPFYKEQHHVLNPAERQLSGVNGVTAQNDTTIVFELDRRDSRFLEKLASPYAVIYPREAVNEQNPSAFQPVGTGPFTFSQKQGGNHYIFSAYQNYYRQNEPVLNRVDITVTADGEVLAQALQKGELHLAPQLGPVSMRSVLNADGKLNDAIAGRFNLVQPPGKTFYALNYNPESSLSRESALAIAGYADPDAYFSGIPNGVIKFGTSGETGSSAGITGADTLTTTFVSDPFLETFMRALADTLGRDGVTLDMADIRTPVRSTGLYTSSHIPLHPADSSDGAANTLISFSVRQTAVSLNSIEHLTFNNFPWWMDLRSVNMPGIDNLGR